MPSKTGTPRSRLIEKALRKEALKEGYQAMAKTDRAAAERHLPAVREILE